MVRGEGARGEGAGRNGARGRGAGYFRNGLFFVILALFRTPVDDV